MAGYGGVETPPFTVRGEKSHLALGARLTESGPAWVPGPDQTVVGQFPGSRLSRPNPLAALSII